MSRRKQIKFQIEEVHYDELANRPIVDGYIVYPDGRKEYTKGHTVQSRYNGDQDKIILFVNNDKGESWKVMEEE